MPSANIQLPCGRPWLTDCFQFSNWNGVCVSVWIVSHTATHVRTPASVFFFVSFWPRMSEQAIRPLQNA